MKMIWPDVPAPKRSVLIYSPQFNTIGGIETHLVNLSCLLAQNHWNVTLVTTSGMLDPARVAALTQAGVDFVAPRANKVLSVARKVAWLTWVVHTRFARRPWNLIYTNAQGSLFWLLRSLKRKHTRLIHHYHTAGDERDQATWSRLFPKWLGAVDEVVACSACTAKNLRRVLPEPDITDRHGRDKLRVIRCLSTEFARPIVVGGDTPRCEPPCADNGRKLRFGFVGRLMRGKGIDTICQLSQDPELAHVEWHLHGCGPDYLPAYFASFPNVHFHGPYSGATELGGILAQLDALALFSRYQEGQPLSLVEGMSAGLPWIASDQGGTRELMWSAENCRLISAECRNDEAKEAVRDLAAAIRAGKTSIAAQRAAYDEHLSPESVGNAWIDYFGGTRGKEQEPFLHKSRSVTAEVVGSEL